jgi:hypothetical protein
MLGHEYLRVGARPGSLTEQRIGGTGAVEHFDRPGRPGDEAVDVQWWAA